MKQILIIPNRLPGLNDIILDARTNKFKSAMQKRKYTDFIINIINFQNIKSFDKKVFISFTWYEKNMKRDPDNIVVGKKYILDALVRSGIIKNDGWENISGFQDKWKVDKKNPRTEVEIYEMPQLPASP